MKKKQRISSSTKKSSVIHLAVFLHLLIIDQLSKYIIRTNFRLGASLHFGKFLSFTYVQNTGISFGMLKGFNGIFTLITIIALGIFLYFYFKERKIQYAVIIAGICGNLIDRIMLGYVVDFINFHYFPIFNVADSAISIGIIWLISSDILKKSS